MKSYGVFAGGGVKGVALAGALASANKNGIRFAGFGGASAGAIIAYLASIGYSGEEIYQKMLRTPFKDMLFYDGGEKYFSLKDHVEGISRFPNYIKKINKGGTHIEFYGNIRKAVSATTPFIKSIRPIYRIINNSALGIYSTKKLKETLIYWTKSKCPNLISSDGNGPTFELLKNETEIDLRVISSNLSSKRALVYSVQNTPSESVIDAVCASASYPFLFNPQIAGEKVLIDGGLSSNLPMFMFKDEMGVGSITTYAFDLFKEENVPLENPGRLDYVARMIDTALEASDHVMSNMLKARRVRIDVPSDIDTLDVNITKLDIMRLYYAGLVNGSNFFEVDKTVQLLQASADDVWKEALAIYGSGKMFSVVLNTIQDIAKINSSEKVRVWLYTPSSRDTIISLANSSNATGNVYEWSTIKRSDAWEAWEKKAEVVSSDKNRHGVTRTRVSFPIPIEDDVLKFERVNSSDSHLAGVLVLDVNVGPNDCYWLDLNKKKPTTLDYFRVNMLEPWLLVLSRMLSKPCH
ncbi:patatin-like phospholipase family protein [Grimontia sp. NTOU-MAR1]|uniref:patatin-like phospholipase family protein n=1 Tax=Grimontia sp. NTOU-MAR1 TaxID=3111011 RepID=UPI002DB7E291|nr:patatin-like phospholipase family protein [Grimontia sp. NTOU-MAR1]WRV96263.1 patatin-like phospholipase family protein [Grimontia sp. NTOU-MAR1]